MTDRAQSPSGPIHSINAITLAVSDMDRSFRFYRALGFRAFAGDERSAFATLRAGRGSFLNLQSDPDHAPVPGIWGRVIFWVDDVDAMHERATAAGYRPEMPPSDAPWGERYFHVRDPDGHELSFAAPLQRDDTTS